MIVIILLIFVTVLVYVELDSTLALTPYWSSEQ